MRKAKATPRIVKPDPKFNDRHVAKFINCLMLKGKKNIAHRIFYGALMRIEEKTEQPGIDVFNKALSNVIPSIETQRRRHGGSIRQIPTEVRHKRKYCLGMRWLIHSARKGHGKSMLEKLANELLAASQGEGNAVKQKLTTHKMAESNRAFAHL